MGIRLRNTMTPTRTRATAPGLPHTPNSIAMSPATMQHCAMFTRRAMSAPPDERRSLVAARRTR